MNPYCLRMPQTNVRSAVSRKNFSVGELKEGDVNFFVLVARMVIMAF